VDRLLTVRHRSGKGLAELSQNVRASNLSEAGASRADRHETTLCTCALSRNTLPQIEVPLRTYATRCSTASATTLGCTSRAKSAYFMRTACVCVPALNTISWSRASTSSANTGSP
jgi:hypothetical protein